MHVETETNSCSRSRAPTCDDIAMIEAWECDAKGYIRERQRRFNKKVTNRPDFQNTYLGRVFTMTMEKRTPAGRLLQTIMADGIEHNSTSPASEMYIFFPPDELHQMQPRYVPQLPWWRHQMETFSMLLAICAGNSPVTGEFPAQRPVTQSFDVFFDLCLNKRLS